MLGEEPQQPTRGWGYVGEGSPPEAGPGGIKPARSGGGRPARLRPLSSPAAGKQGGVRWAEGQSGLGVTLMGRALDRCYSPRAVCAAVQHQSPRAAARPSFFASPVGATSPTAWGAEPPPTPSGGDQPGDFPVCHIASPLRVQLPASPIHHAHPDPTSPRASPGAGDEFYAHSPVFFTSAGDPNFGTPRSPGAFGRASRRVTLGTRASSRFAGAQGTGAAYSPGSPSDVVARRANGKGTIQYLFPTDSPGSGALSPGTGGEPSHVTPETQRTGRRHLMGDELAPTALLDTFEMGDLHAMSPVFTPGKFIMNTWSPKGSPSSVGSIPIEYDEDEYGFDRDIDYGQFEYLNDMIPPANFTIPKPADAARLRGDSDSEEEADGGAAGGSTPRASLIGVASPRSGARRQGSKTPRGSGRRGLRLQLDVSPGSGQKSVGRRLFAVSNPSRPKSGRGPVKPGMRPRIGASRLGKMAAAGPEDLSHLQDNADGSPESPQFHRFQESDLSTVAECSQQGRPAGPGAPAGAARCPFTEEEEEECATATRLFEPVPRQEYHPPPRAAAGRVLRRCQSAQAAPTKLPDITGRRLGMQDRSTSRADVAGQHAESAGAPLQPTRPRRIQSFNPRAKQHADAAATRERAGLHVQGRAVPGRPPSARGPLRQLERNAARPADGCELLPPVRGAAPQAESPSQLTQDKGFGPQVSSVPQLPALQARRPAYLA